MVAGHLAGFGNNLQQKQMNIRVGVCSLRQFGHIVFVTTVAIFWKVIRQLHKYTNFHISTFI